MKLATLKDGTRDGQLIIVSSSLQRGLKAPDHCKTLQYALDNWQDLSGELDHLYRDINTNPQYKDAFAIDFKSLASPLPRAYQWLDGSAYVNHVELVRKSRGVEMPASFWTDPLMYQGGSDSFWGPHEDILVADENWGVDFESEVAVITDDVPMGVPAHKAGGHIKLVMLVNDVSLRNLIPHELTKGFGFLQGKPSSAFSPVALTPDELAGNWRDAVVHLPLESWLNDKKFGAPDAGTDMVFNFSDLIAHAAKTRALCSGTIIGSGTVSNTDRSKGSSCIVERRMLEKIETGTAKTNFMRFGDRIKIQMLNENGESLFGTIDQVVKKYVHV